MSECLLFFMQLYTPITFWITISAKNVILIIIMMIKLWNLKVTVIPIAIDALGTLPESFVKGLEDLEIGGQAKTILSTAFSKIGQNSEKRPEETCCHSDSSERSSFNSSVKKKKNCEDWYHYNTSSMYENCFYSIFIYCQRALLF